MPSYLVLRIICFIAAVALPLLFFEPKTFAIFSMPLTMAHYLLAVPYSKKFVTDAMSRPTTGTYFLLLIACSILLAWFNPRYLLFVAFGIHFVFSEVYLMFENNLPKLWTATRALRIASIICNIFVYFASTRYPTFGHTAQVEIFYWTGYAISATVLACLIFKTRKHLTKEQLVNVCAFETLGLAFVLMGLIHPVSLANFIFYHVVFWVLYPSWKMVSARQTKPLTVYLCANVALTGLIVALSPYSPLPINFLSVPEFFSLYVWGALVHIVISLGMTTAQPEWITRIFHPNIRRTESALTAAKKLVETNAVAAR